MAATELQWPSRFVAALALSLVCPACELHTSSRDGAHVAPSPVRTWQTNAPAEVQIVPPPDDVKCADPDAFVANVLPELRDYCVSCHAGSKLAATIALDLRTAPQNLAAQPAEACRIVLYSLDPENPGDSSFFTAVDPASSDVHDFKFATAAAYAQFRAAAVVWLEKE